MNDRASFLFGCHHKTGTVWLRRFATRLAASTGRAFVDFAALDAAQQRAMLQEPPAGDRPLLVFDFHSCARLPDAAANWQGLHLIRDPRDVALSAANYHGWADETWLRTPRGADGASYQATMRPLALAQAVEFELDHETGATIRDMLAFEGGPRWLTVAYERLVERAVPATLTAIADHLGVARRLIVRACAYARGTKAARQHRARIGIGSHVQDGSPRQWVWLFDEAMIGGFERRFPGAAERLGYEPSRVEALRQDPARRLRYTSRYWANRGIWDRAIADATALLAVAEDAGAREWLALLQRLAGTGV